MSLNNIDKLKENKQTGLGVVALISVALFTSACGGSSGSSETEEIVETPVDTTPAPTPDPTPDPDPDPETSASPNILFIISDDQGLDTSAQYSYSDNVPQTPVLDAIAEQGVIYDNAWATPACTTTRATILTGKYGVNSGVTYVPAKLSEDHETLQQYLLNNENTQGINSAVFGKWHVQGGGANASHPNDVGVEHYAGNLSNIDNYFSWPLTVNGVTEMVEEYHTTKITDLAIEWIAEQTASSTPWFAWVAYAAPHSPYHLPPNELHQRNLSGTADDITNNRREYYRAAIEAMDTEIGRLTDSLSDEDLANTIIIYIGDNGTPAVVIDRSVYQGTHSKFTLYQGGVAIPMFISGKGVTRTNARDNTLLTTTDLYATIAELAGVESTKIYDSVSFADTLLLENENSVDTEQQYVYTEYSSDDVTGWAVRSTTHKLIELEDGSQELYLLSDDFAEDENLLPTSDSDLLTILSNLETYANGVTGHSDDAPIDITNAIFTNLSGNCKEYAENYTSNVMDVNKSINFEGDLMISVVGDKCIFNTNAIPNHDFNDAVAEFTNPVSVQNDRYEVTSAPSFSAESTALSLTINNAIMLNGVKVDLLAGGCYNVGNGKTGCNDMDTPWRYNPIAPGSGFRVDSHNAHAQSNGTYHYHGSPFAMFNDDDSVASPVIGFAADGFPIFGSYYEEEGTGLIKKARSSYQVKSGTRPAGDGNPLGDYDGTYRDDHEYIAGSGELDECNGMMLNGVYGYYVSDNYPYVMNCFKGTPDSSFHK